MSSFAKCLPFQFLVLTVAGFIQRQQQDIIDYLLEENRALREQLQGQRLVLTDAQRRRLAVCAKKLGRATLRQIANISPQPCGQLLEQIARNLTDPFDGFLRGHRFVIHDRDPLFTHQFASVLSDAGVQTVRLPAHSPNLNAFAERFVGSIRRECLDHIIPLGEAHLRLVVRKFVEHYNAERHHQGLGNRLIDASSAPENDNGAIQIRSRLGGLLSLESGLVQ